MHEQYLPQRLAEEERNHIAWCDLYYQFSYHITDKETVTIGERDNCIDGMICAIQEFWNETPLDDLLKTTKQDIVSQLSSLAAGYSNEKIVITVDRVHFESVDEKNDRRKY